MQINESLVAQPGLGNNDVYSRIISNGNFWDFISLAWVVLETVNCRVFMVETPIDTNYSGYSCSFTPPPNGPWAVELVQETTGEKLGNDIVWGDPFTVPTAPGPVLTVQDLILAQLRLIGVIESGESPDLSMVADMIQGNNIMLDSWSAQRLMVRSLAQEVFPLQRGVGSYLVGPGKTWNTTKPQTITDAFVRDSAGLDYPLEIYAENQYKSRSDKSFSLGRPEALWYDPGPAQQTAQAGTVNVYGIPDDNYDIYLTGQKALTELVNASDALNIDKAYLRALKWNGVIEMYHEFRSHGTSIPVSYLKNAKESLNVIKLMNSTPLITGTDLPGAKRGNFDFMSGGVY